MINAKEVNDFPYTSKLVCYIEVDSINGVKQLDMKEAFKSIKAGKSKIYAVWTGQRKSDLFEVDDLDAFAMAIF